MKLCIAFAFQNFITSHYIVFLCLAIFLTPAKNIRSALRVGEIKIEKIEQRALASENTEEILHGELLFR